MKWKSEVTRDDLCFDVSRKIPFVKIDGNLWNLKEREKRMALWNDRDNRLMCFVSPRYNPIPHTTVIDALEEALESMKIDPKEIQYIATPTKNRMWAAVHIKDVQAPIDEKGTKDDWKLGVNVTHGLDGIAGLHVMPAVQRMVCSNGLWMRKVLGNERKTHKTINLGDWFRDTITETLQELDKQFEIIPKLHKIVIKREDFMKKVEKKLGKEFLQQVVDELNNPSNNNPLYRVTEKDLSLYDGMNALSYINMKRCEEIGALRIKDYHTRIESIIRGFI